MSEKSPKCVTVGDSSLQKAIEAFASLTSCYVCGQPVWWFVTWIGVSRAISVLHDPFGGSDLQKETLGRPQSAGKPSKANIRIEGGAHAGVAFEIVLLTKHP